MMDVMVIIDIRCQWLCLQFFKPTISTDVSPTIYHKINVTIFFEKV